MPEQQKLETLLADDSFVRWITNGADDEEADRWKRWMAKDPKRKELVSQAHELVDIAGYSEPTVISPEQEFTRLEQSMNEMNNKSPVHFIHTIKNKSGAFYGAVAACIITIVAILGFLVMQNWEASGFQGEEIAEAKHEFSTDYGEKISLNLSDGSEIILNANSHLRYLTSIKEGQDIQIWLEGEAYFDIYHFEQSQQRTFTVHTPDGAVEVLGTQFSVKTTADGTQTVLKEGKVRVKVNAGDTGQRFNTEVVMRPGELAHFSSGIEQVKLTEVNSRIYTSWVGDTWFFDDTPIKQVASRIEYTFGVEVEIGKDLQERSLSGSIPSTNLDFITEALSKAVNAPITREDNKLIIGQKAYQLQTEN